MRTPGARQPAQVRRLVLAAAPALLIGCGARGEPSPLRGTDDGRQTIVLTTPSGTAEATIRRDSHVAVADLPARRVDAWPHLLEAWAEAGLPDPVIDRAGYMLVVTNRTVQRRLGRRPMSAYLSCGTSISGPNADSHRIRLSAQTLLESAGPERSLLHVRIEATAFSTEGASATPLACASLGTLEALIVKGVLERLAAAD